MRAPKKCPRCGLVSPQEAVLCDCGYDFVDRAGGGRPPPPEGAGRAVFLVGCMLLGGVAGFTLFCIAPSKSRSGLAFLVSPLWALAGAAAGGVVAACVAWWRGAADD